MNQIDASVCQLENIAHATCKLVVKVDHEYLSFIRPGQFVHIQIGQGYEHMLRRPISIADFDLETGQLTVIFKVIGEGTRKLSELTEGSVINLLLPLGQGYPIQQLSLKKALLIGGGIGVPPLYLLAKQLVDRGVSVTTVIGFQTKDDVFYHEEFSQLGKCYVTTNDGSYQHKGFVTDIINLEQLTADYYFSCGPTAMLKAVQSTMVNCPGYLSLEERMGCGIGACYACVISNAEQTAYKKICQDGPVFAASEVSL